MKKEYNIIKELEIKTKKGVWVQVEMLEGKEKGMRRPLLMKGNHDLVIRPKVA
jgi:hypothetical protein